MPLKKRQRYASTIERSALSQVLLLFLCIHLFVLIIIGRGFGKKPNSLPPTLSICDVTEISFDMTKFTLDEQLTYRGHVPPVKTSYAYGPYITKSGSTSIVKALQCASQRKKSVDLNAMGEKELDQYKFISVLRHPLERALAGFHQVEVFYQKKWINRTINERQLQWWNKTCLNSTWEGQSNVQPHACLGSHRKTTTERRLQRLNDFLNEIVEKGFWDQHVTPMTYLIASNRFHKRTTYFDIKHLNVLVDIILKSAGKKEYDIVFHEQKRGGIENGQDWVIKWDELVELAPKFESAQLAIGKLCRMYQSDVDCLPYDVQECKAINA